MNKDVGSDPDWCSAAEARDRWGCEASRRRYLVADRHVGVDAAGVRHLCFCGFHGSQSSDAGFWVRQPGRAVVSDDCAIAVEPKNAHFGTERTSHGWSFVVGA